MFDLLVILFAYRCRALQDSIAALGQGAASPSEYFSFVSRLRDPLGVSVRFVQLQVSGFVFDILILCSDPAHWLCVTPQCEFELHRLTIAPLRVTVWAAHSTKNLVAEQEAGI